jgi:Kinesin motor domain
VLDRPCCYCGGMQCATSCSCCRTVRPIGTWTKMNKESSRSHCVFTCVVESKTTEDGMVNIRTSCLNLVDLAGGWGGA